MEEKVWRKEEGGGEKERKLKCGRKGLTERGGGKERELGEGGVKKTSKEGRIEREEKFFVFAGVGACLFFFFLEWK